MAAGISIQELEAATEDAIGVLESWRDADILYDAQFGTLEPVLDRVRAVCRYAKAAKPHVPSAGTTIEGRMLDDIYSVVSRDFDSGDVGTMATELELVNNYTAKLSVDLLTMLENADPSAEDLVAMLEAVSDDAAKWQGRRDFDEFGRQSHPSSQFLGAAADLSVMPDVALRVEVAAGNVVELIGSLLAERDELERQLTASLDDRQAAERTIAVLIAQNQALRAAQATGDTPTRIKLLQAVGKGLVPILAFIAGHTTAAVQGEYDVRVAHIQGDTSRDIADQDQETAIRVARIAAQAEVRAAEIDSDGPP